MSDVEVPMTAAIVLVGDYNHIFSLRKICRAHGVQARSLQEIHSNYNKIKRIPATVLEKIEQVKPGSKIDIFNDRWDVEEEDELMELGFELREYIWLWSEPQGRLGRIASSPVDCNGRNH